MVILLALLASPTLHVYIDPVLPEPLIVSCCEEWMRHVDGQVVMVDSPYKADIKFFYQDLPRGTYGLCPKANILSYPTRTHQALVLLDRRGMQRHVVLHELGHAFGLRTHEVYNSVLSENRSTLGKFDKEWINFIYGNTHENPIAIYSSL